jgi:hypothetical protein
MKPLRLLALALIVCGLVVGPAYWVYSKFYTGADAALVTLHPLETKPGLARVWQSEPFALTGEMAPAGLILIAQGRFSPGLDERRPPRDGYSATLARDGVAGNPLAFSLGVKYVSDSNPAFREHLFLMQKVQAGRYVLTVRQAAEPAIQIDRMQLQVRRNLQEPNPDVVMAGLGLLVLGLFGLVLT